MSIILKSGTSGNLATIDSLGNLQVLASPAAISQVAAPWTSATAVDTAQVLLSTGGYACIIVQLNQTSTITGGAVTFEGTYDAINWVSLPATFVLDPQTFASSPNPYTLQANTNHSILLLAGGFQQVRMRLNPAISGTGQVTTYWTLQSNSPLQELASVSIIGTVSVTGTVTANIGTTGGLALDATLTSGAAKTQMYDGTNVIGTAAHPVQVSLANTGANATAIKVDGSAVVQPVSGTVTANQGTSPWVVSLASTTITGTVAVTQSTSPWVENLTQVGGSALSLGQKTSANSIPVVVASDNVLSVQGSGTQTQSAAVWNNSTGVNTAISVFSNSFVENTVSVELIQTSTITQGSITFEGSIDGINWIAVNGFDVGTDAPMSSGTYTLQASTNKVFVFNVSGVSSFRYRLSQTISGTGSVTSSWLTQGLGSPNVTISNSNIHVNSDQGAPTSLSNGWPVKITDGSNVLGTNANPVRTDPTGVTTQPVSGTVAVSSVSGTVAVTQSTSPWVVSLASTTITGTVAVTQSTTPWTVQGDSASGAAKAGNPVQIGGVFNTTQPTVTTGQTVEAQATARGAQIVSTGVDTFNVTVNAPLPAGTNVIGHVITDTGSTTVITGTVAVTQSTSPWVENLTQVAGTALGATAVTNFGTAPAAALVMGVNANIYSAGAAITAAAPLGVQLSQGNAVISNTNPIFSSITDGTTKATVIAATAALKTDLSSVAGTATVTAATGVQKVGIVGNTGASVDATIGAGTAPTNMVAVGGQYNTTIPAPTAAQTLSIQLDSVGSQYVNTEGRKTTYRVGIVGFTPITSATAPTVSITGSGTKTVRITRIVFSSSAATGTIADLQMRRYSALTGGTAVSQAANVAKLDSNNATQTAVVNQWTAAATTATSAGIINAKRYEVVTAAVSVQPGEIEWKFGDDNGQGLVLRGTSEFAGIMISAVGTTPLADCWVEWTEE